MDLIRCCEKCYHSLENPCSYYVLCLHGIKSSCHENESCRSKIKEVIKYYKKEGLEKPAIYVGMGTCGLGAGAGATYEKIKNYVNQKGIEADIIPVGCIGLCAEEPIVDIKLPGRTRVSFKRIAEDKVSDLLDRFLNGEIPYDLVIGQFEEDNVLPFEELSFINEHPFFKDQTRWVLENCGIINPDSIEEYISRGGYLALNKVLLQMTKEEVCDVIEESGLRGRGGGGFPTGKKWKMALSEVSDQKYIICNADEGDPGAFMDRAVIEGDPHKLLEGLLIGAYAIGASKAYIYIRAEYPLAIERLEKAIKEAKRYGFIGTNVLDSSFSIDVIIKKGAGAFVCGEETALIHSIEGKRGMPRPRPPYPVKSGLFGKPTVINNVETLANVPEIIKKGVEKFKSLGTERSKGTKVFALSGKIKRTGLVEVEMGTTIRDIVFNIGGGIPGGKKFKAVQIGGPSGGCIPEQHLDVQIDYESLLSIGAMMGSGGLVVMDEDNCMVDVAKFFMDFIQRESCGKCIPCREGTKRMLDILNSISRSRKNESKIEALERFKGIMYLTRLAEVIKDTSLCGLGKSAPNPVLSTLRWFRDEYEVHVYERKCPAGVCAELMSYTIDTELCRGCTLCAKHCPVNAIVGKPGTPHYIIEDKCIACGSCYDICKFKAVVRR